MSQKKKKNQQAKIQYWFKTKGKRTNLQDPDWVASTINWLAEESL